MGDQQLVPLAPYETGGWSFTGTCGYYIHHNRVYLQGEISSGGSVASLILTGLPPGLCPAADTALTLVIDPRNSTDPATPGIVLPLTLAATITTTGDLSLDGLPPYIDTSPPSTPYSHMVNVDGTIAPDFTSPLSYAIMLANLSWPIPGDPTDTAAPISLATLLSSADFADIDSTISNHGTRIHLGGHVRALVDMPAVLVAFGGLSAAVQAGLDPTGESYTTAHGPEGPVVLVLDDDGGVFLSSDFVPVTPGPPAWGPPLPTATENPTPPGGLVTKLRGQPPAAVETITTTGSLLPGPHGAILPHTRDVVDDGVGLGSISGHQEVFDINNGTYECFFDYVPGPTPPGTVVRARSECPAGGSGGAATAQIADLLAHFYPLPDWFSLWVTFTAFGEAPNQGCGTPFNIGPEFFIECGPQLTPEVAATATCDVPARIVSGTDGTVQTTTEDVFGTPLVHSAFPYVDSQGANISGLYSWLLTGFVARPGATVYPHDPNLLSTATLWRPGEINTLGYALGGLYVGHVEIEINLHAYWLLRRDFLKAGDVLDLTGAGWQGISPSTVMAGPPSTGLRTRKMILGTQTP